MSIRNIDADLASNKLNELFHLHRYEDCALFINRLSYATIKMVISQISIEMYLSRLPYTIEIFEAIYAKIFIMDPENFPTRSLQPERLLDRMISYFSLLNDQTEGMEPVDGPKMLDSFENVIRIISYVQPNLYSRLLYFKFAIDKALLTFEKDLSLLNKSIKHTNALKSSSSFTKNATDSITNFLLISRATNIQLCESVKSELTQTANNCEKALSKLNDHINNLKSQKAYKDVQFYLNQLVMNGNDNVISNDKVSRSNKDSDKTTKKENLAAKETSIKRDRKSLTLGAGTSSTGSSNVRSESLPSKQKQQPKSLSSNAINEKLKTSNSSTRKLDEINTDDSKNSSNSKFIKSTICQEFIQNRLYLNKAMMNSIEPYLETIKLQEIINSLYEKIDLDKEILLVFTYLKKEEKYLSSLESLEPLFRRYSLGFERCIRIWRRKCSADSLLYINNENELNDLSLMQQPPQPSVDQLYVVNKEDSNHLDRMQLSFSSSAVAATGLASNTHDNLGQSNISFSSSMNLNPKTQKLLSDLYTGPMPSIYCTMPTKLKSQKNRLKLNLNDDSQQFIAQQLKETIANTEAIQAKPKSILSKTSLSHSNIDKLIVCKSDEDKNEREQKQQLPRNEVPMSISSKHLNTTPPNNEFVTPSDSTNNLNSKLLQDIQIEQQQQHVFNNQLKDEIDRLTLELENYKATVNKLKQNETELLERLKDQEATSDYKLTTSGNFYFKNEKKLQLSANGSLAENSNNTSEILNSYKILNSKYRCEAFESLNQIKEIKDMGEFKLKLLFSVVILANRFVKIFIRDLKRKVRTLLQINEQFSATTERSNSQKAGQSTIPQTPTIVIQGVDNKNGAPSKSADDSSDVYQQASTHVSRYLNRCSSKDFSNRKSLDGSNSGGSMADNSASLIESALNKYLQVCTLNQSFDLNKIIDDVKNQLWSTLHEYPLKDCDELNNFISESVKTCWSFINHQPAFRLDYSNTKFDAKLHERTESSNKKSDHIIQYIWPSLMDSSDGSCLCRGIVIT